MTKTESLSTQITASSLSTYLRRISRISLLSRIEEKEIAKRVRKGESEALQRLVEGNLRFVVKVARRYIGRGISLADLISEGNIGLIKAAQRFDPDRGVKFITYAAWWIQQSIRQAIAEQSSAVRLPLNRFGHLFKIDRKYQELLKALEREPTVEDLARELGMPAADIEMTVIASRKALSLNNPLTEDATTDYIDQLEALDYPPPDHHLAGITLAKEINKLLKKLDPQEAEVIRLRFGLNGGEPLTLEKIGKIRALSRERIRQIEKRAKERLLRLARYQQLENFLN